MKRVNITPVSPYGYIDHPLRPIETIDINNTIDKQEHFITIDINNIIDKQLHFITKDEKHAIEEQLGSL